MKLRLPDASTMQRNILRVYFDSTEVERLNGARWYSDANKLATSLAARHNVTLAQSAAVISILSPSNTWDRNIDDAETLIAAWNAGYGPNDFRVSTYAANRRKAWWMLEEQSSPSEMFGPRALKTGAFYKLILDPTDDSTVTVDGHAFGIAVGVRSPLQGNDIPGLEYKDRYGRISRAYIRAADTQDLLPHQMQATTWLAWRRIHDV